MMKVTQRVIGSLVKAGCILAATSAAANLDEAKWIGYTQDDRSSQHVTRVVHPARLKNPESRRTHVSPLLRKTFTVDGAVRSATVQVCGLGLNELYLNRQKVGDEVLSPAPTTYDKLSFYTVHEVSSNLRQGENAIGLWLGNGFYGQNFGFVAPHYHYAEPRAKLVLTIEYVNGTTQQVVTDNNWKAAQSPILFDNLYGGETYDARLEIPGWSEPGFNDVDWVEVQMMKTPTNTLVKQQLEPIRKVRKLKPVAVLPAENGEWIVDLGENIAGWIELHLNEPRGTEIEMRFAEHLMRGGKAIDTASTGVHATGCEQIDLYICKGGGESWEPRFTYHGFRYVQIKGLSQKPDASTITGWFVRNDFKRIGTFECSDPVINRFYEVSMRTIEGNLHGLISDCPHRERCAWLGDMHACAEAVNMNYAASRLWRKHVADFGTTLGASNLPKPHYPADDFPAEVDPRAPSNVACGRRLNGMARPDWGMAMVLVPWYNWLYFGDRETAENAWGMMEDYMQFLLEVEVLDNLIKKGYSYGDWCPPGSNSNMDTSPQLSASILYYRSLRVMAQMAKLLGKPDAETLYLDRATGVKEAINKNFFDAVNNDYGTQTATAMALQDGVVPAGKEAAVAAGLNRVILEKNGGVYTTGIMGHRPLYTVLNDHGFSETTEKLWANTEYPSLGYATEKHGLTTWPESIQNWEQGYGNSSFSHPMQSGFAVTFHESICGIRPDWDQPGFEKIILQPIFLEGLDWATATYDSVQGTIVSKWRQGEGRIQWDVIVPDGATAEVRLPFDPAAIQRNGKPVNSTGKTGAYNCFSIQAGKHCIDIKMTGNMK